MIKSAMAGGQGLRQGDGRRCQGGDMKRPLGRFRDRKSRIRIFFPKLGHNIGGGGGFGAANFLGSFG